MLRLFLTYWKILKEAPKFQIFNKKAKKLFKYYRGISSKDHIQEKLNDTSKYIIEILIQ